MKVRRIAPRYEGRKLKVAAYCRISTDKSSQEESLETQRSTYEANRRRTELGIYKIGNNQVLGYDADKDGKPVPNKDAWIVKMIFELYAEGKEIYQIVDALESADAVTLRSEKRITRQQVRYILQNEVYVGDKLLQKRNPKDLHTKQPDPKREKTSRYLSEDHVPIIPRELWNAVQTRFNKNGGKCENRKNAHFLAGRLYCAQCGSVFMRKTYKDRQGNLNRAWKCKGREAGLCTAPIWKEDDLISQISQISQTGSEAQIEQGSGNYLIIGKEIQQTA